MLLVLFLQHSATLLKEQLALAALRKQQTMIYLPQFHRRRRGALLQHLLRLLPYNRFDKIIFEGAAAELVHAKLVIIILLFSPLLL